MTRQTATGLVGIWIGVLGVLLQSSAIFERLARLVANVHAVEKAPAPVWEPLLFFGGAILMIGGLCVHAKSKRLSWFWGLPAVAMLPGWLIGTLLVLRSADRSTQ